MLDREVHVVSTGIQAVNIVYAKKNEAGDTVHKLVWHEIKSSLSY